MIGTDTGVYMKALEDTHVNLLFSSDSPIEQLNVLYSANMLIVRTGKLTIHRRRSMTQTKKLILAANRELAMYSLDNLYMATSKRDIASMRGYPIQSGVSQVAIGHNDLLVYKKRQSRHVVLAGMQPSDELRDRSYRSRFTLFSPPSFGYHSPMKSMFQPCPNIQVRCFIYCIMLSLLGTYNKG